MNIFGHHRGWADRRSVLIAGLGDLLPDVVTFQEAIRTRGYDQVTEVLGPGYHVFHQAGRSDDGVGASIASRWPIEVVREADLPAPGGDPTGWIGSLAVARIDVPEPIGPVLLAHHKPTWHSNMEHVRELQAVASARHIEAVLDGTDHHVILAGDLDATPDAASVRFWTGRQSLDGMSVYYQDAWAAIHPGEPGHTFTPRNGLVSGVWAPRPGRRIDYIFVRCGTKGAMLDITACERVFSAPVAGIWASDHFGVMADLTPRAPTTDPP
jgi:endonuclease/exonuclease/phosphatase family metal-dependent hydrolase